MNSIWPTVYPVSPQNILDHTELTSEEIHFLAHPESTWMQMWGGTKQLT